MCVKLVIKSRFFLFQNMVSSSEVDVKSGMNCIEGSLGRGRVVEPLKGG